MRVRIINQRTRILVKPCVGDCEIVATRVNRFQPFGAYRLCHSSLIISQHKQLFCYAFLQQPRTGIRAAVDRLEEFAQFVRARVFGFGGCAGLGKPQLAKVFSYLLAMCSCIANRGL